MKYKVGDKVRIKSLDWYNKNKGNIDKTNNVWCEDGSAWFFYHMSQYCGKIMTITNVWALARSYTLEGSDSRWTDEMIEGLVEEEKVSNANSITRDRVDKLACKNDEELPSGNPYEWECPDGYIFKDENGNVINATKIVMEKKKKEYPKTVDRCRAIVGAMSGYGAFGYQAELMSSFMSLLICRDAYWKIAGEEMGLGKPWKPDWNTSEPKYVIACTSNGIEKQWEATYRKCFAFPTKEMRDAFKENFDPDIEICKELL